MGNPSFVLLCFRREEVRRAEEARLAAWRNADGAHSPSLGGSAAAKRRGAAAAAAAAAAAEEGAGDAAGSMGAGSGRVPTARQQAAAAAVHKGAAAAAAASAAPWQALGRAGAIPASGGASASAAAAHRASAGRSAAVEVLQPAHMAASSSAAAAVAAPAASASETFKGGGISGGACNGVATGTVWDRKPSIEDWGVDRTGARWGAGASASGGGSAHAQAPTVQEVRYDDGRVERTFADGRREVRFANGTRKLTGADGAACVLFTNGDAKRTLPGARQQSAVGDRLRLCSATMPRRLRGLSDASCLEMPTIFVCFRASGGLVEYYYSEVDTWHVTHPSGAEARQQALSFLFAASIQVLVPVFFAPLSRE